MKITNLGFTSYDGASTEANISLAFEGATVEEANAAVMALLSGRPVADAPGGSRAFPLTPEMVGMVKEANEVMAPMAFTPSTAPTPDAPRARRPRLVVPVEAPPSPALVEALAAIAVATEPRTRRSRAAAPVPAPAPEPEIPQNRTITDADLSKACSDAAAIVGPSVVTLVLTDYGVDRVNEIAPEDREKFLADLDDEIVLAKADAAAAKLVS